MVSTIDARFVDRADELIAAIGGGKLIGKIVFDQVYAAIQHENLAYKHPRGGQAKYLQIALYNGYRQSYKNLGTYLFVGNIRDNMVVETNSIAEEASRRAPIDMGDLRNSHAVTVYDGANKVYYRRPPVRTRLTDYGLRQKSKRRRNR